MFTFFSYEIWKLRAGLPSPAPDGSFRAEACSWAIDVMPVAAVNPGTRCRDETLAGSNFPPCLSTWTGDVLAQVFQLPGVFFFLLTTDDHSSFQDDGPSESELTSIVT